MLDVHVLESLPSPTEPLPTGVEREVPGNRAEHEVWVAPWTRPLSAGTAGADTANVARAFDAALGKAPQHESPAPLHRDPDVAAVCAQLSREALAVERAAWTRGTAACVAGSGPLLTTAPLPAGEALPQDCSEEAAAAAVAVVSGARFHAALQYTDALWRPLSGPAARPFAGLDNLRGDAVRFQTFGSTAVLVLRAHSPALDGDAATTAAAARVTSAQWRFLRKLLKGAGNEGVTTVVAVSQVTVSATARADDGVSKPTLAPSEAEAARGEDAGVLLSLLHTWVDAVRGIPPFRGIAAPRLTQTPCTPWGRRPATGQRSSFTQAGDLPPLEGGRSSPCTPRGAAWCPSSPLQRGPHRRSQAQSRSCCWAPLAGAVQWRCWRWLETCSPGRRAPSRESPCACAHLSARETTLSF